VIVNFCISVEGNAEEITDGADENGREVFRNVYRMMMN